MKSIWKGSISFALVSIQVKLYPAIRKKDISFKLLHKKDSSPIEYKRFCQAENVEVAWGDIARGFQYQKNKFVVINEEEFEKLPQKASHTISIEGFIEADEVEPIYFDKSYLLEPEEGSQRSYALLREAMRQTGKAALARVTLKEKEHMAVIRLYSGALLLNTLMYADEIANVEEISIPPAMDLKDAELSLAKELVTRFSSGFKPGQYKDTYREALMELINAKVEGRKIAVPPPPKGPAKVLSLMDALRKSLEKGRPGGVPAEAAKVQVSVARHEKKRHTAATEAPGHRAAGPERNTRVKTGR
ncbi:MAG: Ku protein [Nitrospiraceae bacterium]|nr:Ku protein [Nitrospiraceae bacterium]